MYTTTYKKLSVAQLTPEMRKQTAGYWFTVQAIGTPVTAFRSKEAFELWLREHGLSIKKPLVEIGEHSYQSIIGEYKKTSYVNTEAFRKIKPVFETQVLDNGRYTLAKVTIENGIHEIHYINVNYPRVEFDYQESNKIYCGEFK